MEIDPGFELEVPEPRWKSSPLLLEALEQARRVEGDPSKRQLHEALLEQARGIAARLAEAHQQGLKEGFDEARRAGLPIRAAVPALQLLRDGVPLERVAWVTGLSLEVLRGLAALRSDPRDRLAKRP